MSKHPGAEAARKVELAMIYADDGALHTAARLLRNAADDFEGLAKQQDALLAAMIAQGEVEPTRAPRRPARGSR